MRMMGKIAAMASILIGSVATPSVGAAPATVVRNIGVGDPQRRAVLDALRPEIARDLGQTVQFVVRALRVQGDWAFAHVVPQTTTGDAIDLTRTRHAERLRAGMLDGPDVYALLQRAGSAWRVRDFVVGPTDVAYLAWPDAHGAPPALFDRAD